MDTTEIGNKFLALLKSRKFWAGIVGLAYIIVGTRAGIDQEALISGAAVIVSYILGTALEDTAAARK